MKNIKILLALVLGLSSLILSAQVAVTTDGSSADASAMLDVKSTSKGVLITRMTLSQRNSISSPATGLMIYQTDNTPGFYYYSGSGWTQLGANVDLSAYALKNNVLELDNTTSFTPNANYEPATKKYVDDNIPSLTNYALKSEVLTKVNTTSYTPTSDYHPATKKYVDDNNGTSSQWTSSGNNIYFTGGNVGIGCNVTDNTLVIDDGGKIAFQYGGGSSSKSWITKTGTGAMIFDNNYGGATSAYDHYDFRIYGSTKLLIRGDGFIGIGTDNPYKLLHLKAGSSGQVSANTTSQFVIESSSNAGLSILSPSNLGGYILFGDQNSNQVGRIQYMHSNDRMDFVTNSNTRMSIKSDGYVGIGTNDPKQWLHVYEGSSGQSTPNSNSQFVIESNSNSGLQFLTQNSLASYVFFGDQNSNESGKIIYYHSVDRMDFAANGYTSSLFLHGSSGNVSIGTTSNSYKLQVNGQVAGVGSYVNTSDKRFKKDVTPINGALDQILALQGVRFNWNKAVDKELNFDDRTHLGFLAQELEQVIPEVVFTADDDMQTKSVAYGDVVPVLVEAIKEQQEQIEVLKAELIELKNSLGK